jgi:hypothetical protein
MDKGILNNFLIVFKNYKNTYCNIVSRHSMKNWVLSNSQTSNIVCSRFNFCRIDNLADKVSSYSIRSNRIQYTKYNWSYYFQNNDNKVMDMDDKQSQKYLSHLTHTIPYIKHKLCKILNSYSN